MALVGAVKPLSRGSDGSPEAKLGTGRWLFVANIHEATLAKGDGMSYKIFLSHSQQDTELAHLIKSETEALRRATVYLAEDDIQLGSRIANKVIANLRSSDAVLVLLTRKGGESVWVHQEIGAAAAGKLVVPMVEQGSDTSRLGMITDRERLYFDPADPSTAIGSLAEFFGRQANTKELKEIAAILVLAAVVFAIYVSQQKTAGAV